MKLQHLIASVLSKDFRGRAHKMILIVILMIPQQGLASYGQSLCGRDFLCGFSAFLIYVGIFGGIPIACTLFALIHSLLFHRERSKAKQVLVGIIAGLLAFVICGFVTTLVNHMVGSKVGYHSYPLWSLFITAGVCAAVSIVYVRSALGTLRRKLKHGQQQL